MVGPGAGFRSCRTSKSPERRLGASKLWCNLSSYILSIERPDLEPSYKNCGEQSLVPDCPPCDSFMYQDGVDPADSNPHLLTGQVNVLPLHHGPTTRIAS